METISKNGVSIRLSDERWQHITTEHGELEDMHEQVLGAVADPQRILRGGGGELLAVKEVEAGKWMVVVYRELDDDGFIITAFLTRRAKQLDKRDQVWP